MTTAAETDLEVCAREQIHIPGSIQPHGALLVLDPDTLVVIQASRNASDVLGAPIVPGQPVAGAAATLVPGIGEWLTTDEASFQSLVEIAGRKLYAVVHRAEGGIILELEQVSAGQDGMERLFPKLRAFAEKLSAATDGSALYGHAADYLREITGFDRVLVYRFGPDWNGHVVGESGNGVLPSYLDLRFPAADIPAQARQLYRVNRLRIIPQVDYDPVPVEPAVNPLTSAPLDLSLAMLRSVSPVHLEYMRNMGTAASMSISIVVNNELWGLIAGHSRAPHHVSVTIRNLCDFAAQSFATEIASRERAAEAASRVQLGGVLARLLARMTGASDWWRGLAENSEDLLAQVNADGAAIVFDDYFHMRGATPEEHQIHAIVAWLEARGETEIYATESLARDMGAAASFAEAASGLLAVRLSELHPCWLLWFRQEVIQTVEWGGDPHKVVREAGRIHPRRSFEVWSEQLRHHAKPWAAAELGAARDLRGAIIGIVLRRAEELAQLTKELQRSNKELEAFSYSISHDLRAPFRHVVGYAELLRERETSLDEKSSHYLESIVDSAIAAGRLVDDLLHFSHIGRTAITARNVDMDKLVAEVRQSQAFSAQCRDIEWRVDKLPAGWGDPTLLRQVWHNLIENAVKYTRRQNAAVIEISGRTRNGEVCYLIRDNGVGFDMNYVDKLFGVFQRLQRSEDFEGTGIGLALARRIIERHHGRIWAEGVVDQGATFHFALPSRAESPLNG